METDNNAVQTATTETTANKPDTHSTAVNVDVEGIVAQAEQKATEAAEKKMEAVFKSMLKQQGLDADAITKMTADWKATQKTPESELSDLQTAHAEVTKKYENLNMQMTAISKNIPADKAAKYIALAQAYLDDSKDLGKALDLALVDFPLERKETPPPYATDTGADGGAKKEEDVFQKKLNKYRK